MGSQRKLTKRQKDILIGMLLGDGCLEKNGRNVRLRIEHGLSQKDYLDWKYEMRKNAPKFLWRKYPILWTKYAKNDLGNYQFLLDVRLDEAAKLKEENNLTSDKVSSWFFIVKENIKESLGEDEAAKFFKHCNMLIPEAKNGNVSFIFVIDELCKYIKKYVYHISADQLLPTFRTFYHKYCKKNIEGRG